LALDLPARPGEHARNAVAERAITGRADVYGTRWVRADELYLHARKVAHRHRAELAALGQNGIDLPTQPIVGQREVQKARRRGFDPGEKTHRVLGVLRGNSPGDLHRCRT